LKFNEDGFAICKESGEKYQLKNNRLTKIL